MKVRTFNLLKWCLIPFFFPWCFLQNTAGFIVWLWHKAMKQGKRMVSKDGIVYFTTNLFGGVSLGYFIFLNTDNDTDIHHEWGHQLQSLLLGPLYLLVIGLPSGICCGFNLYNGNLYKYYNYPWESWADKWGKIKHENLSYNRTIRQ